ncbi:MAG: O-antigen ligase family protein [Candidatus Omnitrophota bacterium]
MTFKLLLVYLFSLTLTNAYAWVYGQRVQFSEMLFLVLFIFWIKDLIKTKQLPQDTGLNKPFLLFVFFCILSFFNSINLFLSSAELLGTLYLFIMLILVVHIVDSKEKLDIIIKTWIGILSLVLILGLGGLFLSLLTGQKNIFCWVYQGNYPYIKNAYRITSIFHNPLALANYLIISFAFVASDLLLTQDKKYRTFLKILMVFMCLTMLATVSREILSFIIAAFLVYSYFYKKKVVKFKIMRFLSIILIVVIFVYITIFCSAFYISSGKVKDSLKKPDRELSVNINYAYITKLGYKIAALEMVKRHPFLGVGLKMYRSYLQKLNSENYFYKRDIIPLYEYAIGYKYSTSLRINDPHNDVLQYFAETGIFGGCAFIFFLGTFLYIILTNLKDKKLDDQYFKVRLFCFLASFIGILVESIDLDVFKLRFVWFLMALALALIKIHKNQAKRIT